MDIQNTELSKIREELAAMAEEDQTMRRLAIKDRDKYDSSIDKRNTARLKEIVAQIGWPTISKVGREAATHAWLIVQHSLEIDFQKECLQLMREAPTGDVGNNDLACLTDRLLMFDGKPQLYGTQFRPDENGVSQPFEIEDPENLGERRKSLGLIPFEEYQAILRQRYGK